MKNALKTIGSLTTLGLICAVTNLSLVGCSTDAPGVKSNYVQQWSNVSGSVEEVTEAAEDILGEYELKDIKTKTTKLDGSVTGSKADGTVIKVDVRKLTSETSEVSARVGTVGDPTLGVEIVNKIEEKFAD